jgi:hypothetical protein
MAYPSAQQHKLSGVTLRQQPGQPTWNITNLWTIANSLQQKVYTSANESSLLTQPSLVLHTIMALPISLTGQTPTSARAPGLNSAPADVEEMWGTWQMCLAFLHSSKVWFWTVLINKSEKSFAFKLHYSLKQILFRTSYCSLLFSEFLRTLLTKFPTPTCQNQKFRNTNFAST